MTQHDNVSRRPLSSRDVSDHIDPEFTGYISHEVQDASIFGDDTLSAWLGYGTATYNLSDIPADSQEYIDALHDLSSSLVTDLDEDQLFDTYAHLPSASRHIVDRPTIEDRRIIESDLQAFAWRWIDREHGHNTESEN